ncbi:AAA family ATPase [Streptacidiphilus sp. 4-A2]|nr:AAA family ATPase [Streptacidiphilus sp. 4-A2]
MLLRFRVSNHASLRAEQELSLIAGDAAESEDFALRPLPGTPLRVLPVVAVFGANATGKSNLVHALAFMRAAVQDSHQRWLPGRPVPRRAFAFDPAERQRPSVFVMEMLLDGVRHEYGFAVTDRQVAEEWLYDFPKGKRRTLFERDDDGIRYGPGFRGRRKVVADVVRPNSLFLSAGAANNNPSLLRVYEWFSSGLRLAVDANYGSRLGETVALRQGPQRQLLDDLLAYADLGISGLEVIEQPVDTATQERLARALRAVDPDQFGEVAADSFQLFQRVRLSHVGTAGPVSLDLGEESNGTQTWVGLLGPVLGLSPRSGAGRGRAGRPAASTPGCQDRLSVPGRQEQPERCSTPVQHPRCHAAGPHLRRPAAARPGLAHRQGCRRRDLAHTPAGLPATTRRRVQSGARISGRPLRRTALLRRGSAEFPAQCGGSGEREVTAE